MVPHKTKTLSMLIGISALCLVIGVITVKAASDIVLVSVTGQVEVRNPQVGLWTNVSTGTSLHSGDIIRTGPQSSAEIRFESGTIRMYENTLLELPTQPQQLPVSGDSSKLKNVFLRKGRSLFEIFKNRLSGGFEVSSPSLIAGVKGTTFRVTEEEKLKGVTVFEGIVWVTNRHRPEETLEVTANHFTMLSEEHLMPTREFQDQNPGISEDGLEQRKRDPQNTGMEERKLETRLEERLTDMLEENRDLQAEVLSNSIRIDTSSTSTMDTPLTNTDRISILSGTTETPTGGVSDTQSTLSGVTAPTTDLTGTGLITLP